MKIQLRHIKSISEKPLSLGRGWAFALTLCFFIFSAKAQEEKDFYSPGDNQWSNKVHPSYDLSWLHKKGFTPKIGGMDFTADGKLLICTWDPIGAIYELSGVETGDTNQIKIRRIAAGLCEPLGLKVVGKRIFVIQRPELTELIDLNGDGMIDEYKTVCASFGFMGNYHEFTFGLLYRDGWFYTSLSTPRRTKLSAHPDRGKVLRIDTLGNTEFLAEGFRTPNGLCFGPDSLLYVNDNEGEWLPANKMLVVKKGAFYGYRNVDLAGTVDLSVQLPVIWIPHHKIGNSPSQPLIMQDGPYKGQLIHGDVTHGGIKRVFVEKIDTIHQGCIFSFTQGLEGGINRMAWGPDGGLYVGAVGSVGNWGQDNPKHRYGLQKLQYNGKITFEMLAIRAKSNGFEIEFTEPLARDLRLKTSDVRLSHWRYESTEKYGGPKLDQEDLTIKSISLLAGGGKKVFVEVLGLKTNRVVYFKLSDSLQSASKQKLWTSKAWYTVNVLPKSTGAIFNTSKTTSVAVKTAAPKKIVKELSDAEIKAIGPKLIDQSGCLACHTINDKIIGPSFKMVAEKYTADKATIDKLVNKVYNGGKGVWGEEEMSPQSHLSKEEIKKIVRYILGL
jgi:cytochrome c